jgi:hypothetical protein
MCLMLSVSALGGQEPALPQNRGQYIDPSEVNLRIDYDARTLIVMAAINMAGFDYEPGGQPLSPARAELRRDLAGIDPALKQELAQFYRSHRRPEVDEAVDAGRYAALSLLMTDPPIFGLPAPKDNEVTRPSESVPEDLKPLLGFEKLVQKFYATSGIKSLIPKYTAIARAYGDIYRRPVGELTYQVVEYFHARPETIVNMRPIVVGDEAEKPKKGKPGDEKVISRNRTRQIFFTLDPLAALGGSFVRGDLLNRKDDLLYRQIGDDYIVFVGPSRSVNTDALRQALIRFVIDPMIERHLRQSLEYKDQIVKLVASVPTAEKQFKPSVYLVIRESLARAAEARLRRIGAGERGSYGEDDAVYDLAQAYLRGAVLSFHFYESLSNLEKVGISLEEFFDEMVATTKFDSEAERPKQFEPVIARVAAARKERAAKAAAAEPGPPPGSIAAKILQSDDLIRQRRFKEARVLLEDILAADSNNARAVYGMAQVVNNTPGPAESDPRADENDKIQQQHDRLEAAIKLYRKAIAVASKDAEAWLIQRCHVLLGRIYDFQEFRADALAEYEKAIAMGDIPNGAYKEALDGKQRPYGQR